MAHAGRCSPAGKAAACVCARVRGYVRACAFVCVCARAPKEVGDTENIAPRERGRGAPQLLSPAVSESTKAAADALSHCPEPLGPGRGEPGGRRRPRAGRREACRELWSRLSPGLWDVWRRCAGSSFPALLIGPPRSPPSPPLASSSLARSGASPPPPVGLLGSYCRGFRAESRRRRRLPVPARHPPPYWTQARERERRLRSLQRRQGHRRLSPRRRRFRLQRLAGEETPPPRSARREPGPVVLGRMGAGAAERGLGEGAEVAMERRAGGETCPGAGWGRG